MAKRVSSQVWVRGDAAGKPIEVLTGFINAFTTLGTDEMMFQGSLGLATKP